MNKFVAALTASAVVASVVAPVATHANTTSFTDLAGYAQDSQDAVKYLVDLKVVTGTTPTTFSPNTDISRGQIVKILGRYLTNVEGQTVPADWNTKARFTDLPVNHTDKELVQLAALAHDAGIFTGSDGKLMAAGKMTRENLALVVDRLAKEVTGQDLVTIAAALNMTGNVSDLAKAKAESRNAINALNALKISNVAEFNPKGTVKRIHFTSLFAKMLQTVEAATPAPADPAVVALEEVLSKVNVLTATKEELQKVADAFEALTEAQQALLTEAAQSILTDVYSALEIEDLPAEPDVSGFEAAIAAVTIATADKAALEAAVAAYTALTEEEKAALTSATLDKLKAIEAKLAELNTPVTPGPGPVDPAPVDPTPAPTEAELLASKIASIGTLVQSSDVQVAGAGTTVTATVVNPAATFGSFMGLYNELVVNLGIKQVNGLVPNSLAVLGYFSELAGDASNLGELKGKTFALPVVVNNGGTDYATTLTLVIQ
ncbi:S-layer homology domain-containing protein [Caryophanon tenue]|uniref:SLH domain-containing protein n=1 Tax=Caryophanon tenue TaxID=33978 RepID=A0A1C0Y7Z8_9BACL|nr:S-layer homology domain-containing protein [Caryophanon tenue]OCS83287.1 hypothetical protein A6M13_04490 [Caryophanon tenue]